MMSAAKFLLILITGFFLWSSPALAQSSKKKKGNTQEDLDNINKEVWAKQKSPEQKKYEKKMKKEYKAKEKRNAITRKQAEKKSNQRLNSAKSKVRAKKKSYVKTHNKKK